MNRFKKSMREKCIGDLTYSELEFVEKRHNFEIMVLNQADDSVENAIFEAERKLHRVQTECKVVESADIPVIVAVTVMMYGIVNIIIEFTPKKTMGSLVYDLVVYIAGAVAVSLVAMYNLRSRTKCLRTKEFILEEVLKVLKRQQKTVEYMN